MHRLTVMTYNIRTGIGMDGILDLDRIAAVVDASNAHVVGLQEVDRKTARSNHVDQAQALSDLTGLEAVYGPAYAWDGGHFGPATLSMLPIIRSELVTLPYNEHIHESRMAVITHLRWQGREINIINTHLEHEDGRIRGEQGAALGELVRKMNAEGPTILVGDLNAEPNEKSVMDHLNGHVHDVYRLAIERDGDAARKRLGPGYTFDSASPSVRIDYIWVSDHFQLAPGPNPVSIVQSDASDHRPLIAHLVLNDNETDGVS